MTWRYLRTTRLPTMPKQIKTDRGDVLVDTISGSVAGSIKHGLRKWCGELGCRKPGTSQDLTVAGREGTPHEKAVMNQFG